MDVIQELGEDKKIDEEYEEYLRTNVTRNKELIKFVEDFMNSKEFSSAQAKSEPKKYDKVVEHHTICVCTECWENKTDLVKSTQEIWKIKHRFEKFLQNKTIKEIVKHQEESIKVIKEKIAEAKQKYLCHKEERETLKEKRRQEVLEDLKKLYYVNTKFVSTKSKLVERVLVYNKIRHVQRVRKKERIANILKRILNEYKRQRQIDKLKNRRYDTKVIRKEKILKDVEVVGTKIELLPRYEAKLEEVLKKDETLEEKQWEDVAEPEEQKSKKSKKEEKSNKEEKGSKKEKGKKEAKESKTSKKDKKDEKSKKGKDKKEKLDNEEADLVLPYVPITNERQKIKQDEEHKMVDLINQFEAIKEIEREREKFEDQKTLAQGVFYPDDSTFISSPKLLMFEDFKNGVIYKKKIRILNGGTVEKKCRFYLVCLEEFDPTLVQVEPIGVQNVIPGMVFYVTITFSPETLKKPTKGSIIFVTYNSSKNEYKQISIPIFCTPWCSHINIVPDALVFDTLPIWEAKKLCDYENYKTIKIYNKGRKSCKITINKIKDPFQLDDVPSYSDVKSVTDVDQTQHETSKVKNLEQSGEITFINKLNPSTENELDIPAEKSDIIAEQIIDECVDYLFNAFVFDCYCFNVEGKSERIIRIYFKNIDYVGSYNEKYLINVFEEFEEKALEWVGSKELMINAEVTGKFIEVSPKTLDFNACVFNSVYQLCFNVHNKASIPHGVGIKFPSSLKHYLSSSENDVYIQSNEHKRISIKFIPRKEIIICNEVSYYNPETKILEFPIYVCITSKNFLETPPTKVTIFAILTESNGLYLNPEQGYYTSYFNEGCKMNLQHCTCESGADYLIDMGECTTNETVYTELKLTNNSYVFQNFGFLNLPECIKILPNYGFGEIFPMEVKILTLAFSPEAEDIPNYAMECESANKTIVFRISVNTIKNIGGIKRKQKPFKYKFIRKSLDIMEKELRKEVSFPLHEDITTCIDLLRDEAIFQALTLENQLELETNMSYLHETEDGFKQVIENDQLATEEELEEPFTITSNNLWIKATIIDPLCDLSHQYIEFPDTPCGSYSVITISLRTLTNIGDFNCVCGYASKFSKCKKCIQFNVHFEIVGDNHEVNVEPTCGNFKAGQEIKLLLVAQPQLSEKTVMETAKEIKREELIQQKRLQWQKELAAKLEKAQSKDTKDKKGNKDKSKGKNDKKDKKGKKGKLENTSEPIVQKPAEPEPEFIIDDGEIIVDYFDMYPAEMVTWKNMEAYYIEAHFCCTLSYTSTDITRKPEKLYFTATCKVIKPDFIHNLKTQHIDFGPTPIGMTRRKVLSVQNIQYKPINPTITLLCPTGPFTCPSPKNLELLPEHLLQLPITFAPREDREETEYFEIKAGSTVCPLIVSGEGVEVECSLTINPNFVVCRLEANTGGFADCAIEFNNQSKAPLAVELIKICELEGEIKPIEKETTTKEGVSKNATKEKKGKEKNKSKKGKDDKKPKKISKFSQDLTEEEKVSVQKYFVPKNGESFFEILGGYGNIVEVSPFTKKSVKIHFGVPLPPEAGEQKGKSGKKDKKPKGSKSSGSSKKAKKQSGPQKYYVAKFNIMLGTKFLRDAIIIATFI